jgi:hypothetical protein
MSVTHIYNIRAKKRAPSFPLSFFPLLVFALSWRDFEDPALPPTNDLSVIVSTVLRGDEGTSETDAGTAAKDSELRADSEEPDDQSDE